MSDKFIKQLASYRTTLAGIALIGVGCYIAYSKQEVTTELVAFVAAGAGLIASRDA